VEVTNGALNRLLDLLEDRVSTWPGPRQLEEPDTPAAEASLPSDVPVPVPQAEADEEIDDLGIEDAVIRELARALRPR
jgi:hypothetical protein